MRGYNIVNLDFFQSCARPEHLQTHITPPTHPKTDIFFIFCEFDFQLRKNKGKLVFLTHKLSSKIIIKNSPTPLDKEKFQISGWVSGNLQQYIHSFVDIPNNLILRGENGECYFVIIESNLEKYIFLFVVFMQ